MATNHLTVARSSSELRLSVRPFVLALGVAGLGLVVAAEIWSTASLRPRLHVLALGLYCVAATAWLLARWSSTFAAWYLAIALLGTLGATSASLPIPSALSLTAIPTAMLFATLGLRAALFCATLTTAGLLTVQSWQIAVATGAPISAAPVTVALMALWGSLLVLVAFDRRATQLERWLADYSGHAQRLVEESRDRKAELAQALDDLTHLNRQMALMTERQAQLRQLAEDAERAKAAFVARVSHEFRTPLNIIIGMIELMIAADDPNSAGVSGEAMEHLRIVQRNSRHLASMIDDVLDLSRIGAERLALHRTWVHVPQLLKSAISVVQPLMTEKGLSWRIDCPDEMPQIYADRIRIRQVVLNLLSNAARATQKGGITLGVTRQGEEILLSVSDTGPGIAPDVAEVIFEPFVQGSSEREGSGSGGSGLGLSISKRFVELHGGRMWLESTVGEGTTFYVSIPISGPARHPARPGHVIREEWPWIERRSRPRLPQTHFQPRIVLCDATKQLAHTLSQISHDTEIVTEPNLSLAIEKATKGPAAALIVNHPSVHTLLDEVQLASQALMDTPVVGWCCPPRGGTPPLEGVATYLTKPVRRSDMEALLARSGPPTEGILVVEDDPDTLELMRMMLHSLAPQAVVTAVRSAEEALGRLDRRRYGLLLVDLVLPAQSGWDLIAAIRQRHELCHMPIAIVSGQDMPRATVGSHLLVAALDQPIALPSLLAVSQRIVRAYAQLSVEPSRTQR